jgi:hypothetical protein
MENPEKSGNIGPTKRRKSKQKHNTICVGHHYMQANTNNVNMIWSLLQTTGGKIEANYGRHILNIPKLHLMMACVHAYLNDYEMRHANFFFRHNWLLLSKFQLKRKNPANDYFLDGCSVSGLIHSYIWIYTSSVTHADYTQRPHTYDKFISIIIGALLTLMIHFAGSEFYLTLL